MNLYSLFAMNFIRSKPKLEFVINEISSKKNSFKLTPFIDTI